MSAGGPSVEGVVLCTVAGHGLAVLAREVTSVEAPDGVAPWAGLGFDAAAARPEGGRLLRHEGLGVVVDTLEVHGEALPLLPAPPLVSAEGLVGFVEVAGRLWPVVSLRALATRLGALA